jgi:hypothetical protein
MSEGEGRGGGEGEKAVLQIESPRFVPRLAPRPPHTVYYSQALSPTPSTMAVAPELRTAKRSPARPAAKSRPPVAP